MAIYKDVPGEPITVVCENCNAFGPGADTIEEAMRLACRNWGYRWHDDDTRYPEFFCPKCKVEFDLDGGAK